MTMLRALAVALLIPGIAATRTIPGPSVIEMTSTMTFMPRELTVVAGEMVVWKNGGEMPHSVNTDVAQCKGDEARKWIQMPPGATPFFSGEIKPGGEYRLRFEIPGTYQYLCIYHEDQMMRGTVIVQGAEVK